MTPKPPFELFANGIQQARSFTMATPTTLSDPVRNRSRFSALADEIKLNILAYACTNPEPIKPEQWLPGTNTFAHNTPWTTSTFNKVYRDSARENGRLPAALAAVDLMLTNKDINNLVDGESLFYKYNTFQFNNLKSMLKYLVSLTPKRRDAIRAISVTWDMIDAASAFAILSKCRCLRSLSLDITLLDRHFEMGVMSTPGIDNLMGLRGLHSLELIYGDVGGWNLVHQVIVVNRNHDEVTLDLLQEFREEVAEFEKQLVEAVTSQTKDDSRISGDDITLAVESAGVNSRDGDFQKIIKAHEDLSANSSNNSAHTTNLLTGPSVPAEINPWAPYTRETYPW
jgi:hypothetical protein